MTPCLGSKHKLYLILSWLQFGAFLCKMLSSPFHRNRTDCLPTPNGGFVIHFTYNMPWKGCHKLSFSGKYRTISHGWNACRNEEDKVGAALPVIWCFVQPSRCLFGLIWVGWRRSPVLRQEYSHHSVAQFFINLNENDINFFAYLFNYLSSSAR